MELLFFVLVTILFWSIRELINYQVRASRLDFPTLWAIPFIGNFQLLQLVLSKQPLEDHQKIIEKFPNYFKCWFLNFRFLCPHSPEAVRKILKSEECLSRPVFAKIMFSGFSGDSYHEWINKRKFMNQIFYPSSLKNSIKAISAAADDFTCDLSKEINEGKEFDIYPSIARWTIKVHCLFLLGLDDNSINGIIERLDRLINIRNNITHFLILPQLSKLIMPSKFTAMENAKTDLINFTKSLFYNQKTNENATKFEKNYSKILHRDDFAQQIISMMDAGYETVALNLTNVLLFLSKHQKIQEKIYEEIQGIKDEISLESLSKFELIERVIKETLRIAPPLPYLPREVHKTFELEPGKFVEKGTIILIPNYGVHRLNSVYGDEADKFNPDNFLKENLSKRPISSSFQFSHGKRMCIGHRYAMIVMKIFLIKLIKNYKFESDENDLKFTAKVTLEVEGSKTIKAYLR
ncbi:hypothetical protein PVAND_015388 [Polypedilum vanderplanki]|uniref:Cytochrome P450 n=1 Tax=Polypedilum vanderplanki TaxID=319348 RepID=A0A9J6BCN6_POLVA|nr:hypothetical protein PVAND_015388 [Polypedilum vanderplanki]